jgi:hypothetical protein
MCVCVCVYKMHASLRTRLHQGTQARTLNRRVHAGMHTSTQTHTLQPRAYNHEHHQPLPALHQNPRQAWHPQGAPEHGSGLAQPVYMYICVHTYVYVYVCTYVCMYIHTASPAANATSCTRSWASRRRHSSDAKAHVCASFAAASRSLISLCRRRAVASASCCCSNATCAGVCKRIGMYSETRRACS